jgi:hypothetical protein
MVADLKPCPFCGLPGHLEAQFGRQWWVQCENGHSTGIVHASPAEAEEEWNRRIPAGVKAAGVTLPQGAYWWSPKGGSGLSQNLACWSTNPGPHPQWDVTVYYSEAQVRELLAAHGVDSVDGSRKE